MKSIGHFLKGSLFYPYKQGATLWLSYSALRSPPHYSCLEHELWQSIYLLTLANLPVTCIRSLFRYETLLAMDLLVGCCETFRATSTTLMATL